MNDILKAVQSLVEKLCQQEQATNLSIHTPEPSRHFNSICYDEEESNIPLNEIISLHTLSKLNEDECFDPGGDFILEEIEACLTSDSIPSGIDDADFDPEGDILLLEKLLNDHPSSPLPPKELDFTELKVIKSDVSTDFEDDYYDSEGDIIYLESLLIKDTILNLSPDVFLDREPRSLEDELDKDDLKYGQSF
ncbi:hypothetical protein Tco_0226613 [Tanacetum coccineum]